MIDEEDEISTYTITITITITMKHIKHEHTYSGDAHGRFAHAHDTTYQLTCFPAGFFPKHSFHNANNAFNLDPIHSVPNPINPDINIHPDSIRLCIYA